MLGKKNSDDSGASTGGAHHQCGHTVFVLKINNGVKIYERLRDLKTASDASEHQRRLSVTIGFVRIGPALEEEMGGVRVLPEHGGVERRVPGPWGARFNDASSSKKKLERLTRANGRGEPKGRSTVLVLFARARL